jgi:hypothetical protein
MGQIFKPPAIVGSHGARARALAEQIAAEDYGVSNMQPGSREGDRTKVTYKDDSGNVAKANWATPGAMQAGRQVLEAAVALGRETRLKYGSGLDVLQNTLKTGELPDLIENSKRLSHRIW